MTKYLCLSSEFECVSGALPSHVVIVFCIMSRCKLVRSQLMSLSKLINTNGYNNKQLLLKCSKSSITSLVPSDTTYHYIIITIIIIV